MLESHRQLKFFSNIKYSCIFAALTTEAKMNQINSIEFLVKEWLRVKAKEELLNVQRKEIEKKINETLNAGIEINPSILNLLQRVLKIAKKTGTRPDKQKENKNENAN